MAHRPGMSAVASPRRGKLFKSPGGDRVSYMDQVFDWAVQQQAQGESGNLAVSLTSVLQLITANGGETAVIDPPSQIYNLDNMKQNFPAQWWGMLATTPQPGVLTYYPAQRVKEPGLDLGVRIETPAYFMGSVGLAYYDAYGQQRQTNVNIELLSPLVPVPIFEPGAPEPDQPGLQVPGGVGAFEQAQYQLLVTPAPGAGPGIFQGQESVNNQTGASGPNDETPNNNPPPQGALWALFGQGVAPSVVKIVVSNTYELCFPMAYTHVNLSA
jgi:hypothetical protein